MGEGPIIKNLFYSLFRSLFSTSVASIIIRDQSPVVNPENLAVLYLFH